MDKKAEYQKLVQKRKICFECKNLGMTNTSELKFETNNLGKWSDWQDSLNAKILIIGQDWGDVGYWIQNKGIDSQNNKTNETLKDLFFILNYDLGTIHNPVKQNDLFFTNAVLCLKKGGMSASLSTKCFSNCNTLFLAPLMNLLKPKFIITIGSEAYKSVMRSENKTIKNLKEICGKEPILLKNGSYLFPVYHCGGLGLRNRSRNSQVEDWANIRDRIKIIEKNN